MKTLVQAADNILNRGANEHCYECYVAKRIKALMYKAFKAGQLSHDESPEETFREFMEMNFKQKPK